MKLSEFLAFVNLFGLHAGRLHQVHPIRELILCLLFISWKWTLPAPVFCVPALCLSLCRLNLLLLDSLLNAILSNAGAVWRHLLALYGFCITHQYPDNQLRGCSCASQALSGSINTDMPGSKVAEVVCSKGGDAPFFRELHGE